MRKGQTGSWRACSSSTLGWGSSRPASPRHDGSGWRAWAGGTIQILRGGETPTETFEAADPYRAELEEFAAAIREGREPAVGPREILGNARAIGGLLESARSGGQARD